MHLVQSASAAAKSSCCSASSARSEYNSASWGAAAINFVSSGRVSLGGRRAAIDPPGNATARKKTASSLLAASIFSAQWVNSARSPTTPLAIATTVSHFGILPRFLRAFRTGFRLLSGKNFNFHLPAADVVREILRRYGDLIAPSGKRRRHQQFARVRTHLSVPSQICGSGTVHPRHDGPRRIRGAHLQTHRVSTMKLFAIQLHLHRRRLA